MIYREYNPPVRQARIKNFLFGIRVVDFVAEGWETLVALAHVYQTIHNRSRQGPTSYLGDAHRT